MQESFITHSFAPISDFELAVCIHFSDNIFNEVNNLVFFNLNNKEFQLVFEIFVEDKDVHVLSVLNYSCCATEYYTLENVLEIEDEIYKVITDYFNDEIHNVNTLVLNINIVSKIVTILSK